jgi:hypothetical protein
MNFGRFVLKTGSETSSPNQEKKGLKKARFTSIIPLMAAYQSNSLHLQAKSTTFFISNRDLLKTMFTHN